MAAPPEIEIGSLLRKKALRLASAESCTGGLIAHRITNVPGSSDYFLGGVVAYANQVKVGLLNVSPQTLAQHGAVSREAVLEIARGVRWLLNADLAVGASGVAGPGGGTPEKPVGTVWIGLAASDGEWARGFRFPGDRGQNKALSAEAALEMVLEYLKGERKLDRDLAETSAQGQKAVVSELIRRIKAL
jgi:PncC family amidohydrolase